MRNVKHGSPKTTTSTTIQSAITTIKPDKIMQLSIKAIIEISTKEKNILFKVFSRTLQANYDNPAYSLTQVDADNVATALDAESANISAIGSVDLFGEAMTPDRWFEEREEVNRAMIAASSIFKLAGLQEPEAWRAQQHSI